MLSSPPFDPSPHPAAIEPRSPLVFLHTHTVRRVRPHCVCCVTLLFSSQFAEEGGTTFWSFSFDTGRLKSIAAESNAIFLPSKAPVSSPNRGRAELEKMEEQHQALAEEGYHEFVEGSGDHLLHGGHSEVVLQNFWRIKTPGEIVRKID